MTSFIKVIGDVNVPNLTLGFKKLGGDKLPCFVVEWFKMTSLLTFWVSRTWTLGRYRPIDSIKGHLR